MTVGEFQFEAQAGPDWVMGKLSIAVEHGDADGCETAVTIAIDGMLLFPVILLSAVGQRPSLLSDNDAAFLKAKQACRWRRSSCADRLRGTRFN